MPVHLPPRRQERCGARSVLLGVVSDFPTEAERQAATEEPLYTQEAAGYIVVTCERDGIRKGDDSLHRFQYGE
eukprot:jgi/Chrpa1/19989/Chrysochromulina_OHIO_Genome00023816-RA